MAQNPSIISREQLASAKEFVQETQHLLDPWFTQAANLRARIQRGRDVEADQRRALTLREMVASELIDFDRRLSVAPEVAEHSLVRDVRRALLGLVADLGELGGPIG